MCSQSLSPLVDGRVNNVRLPHINKALLQLTIGTKFIFVLFKPEIA